MAIFDKEIKPLGMPLKEAAEKLVSSSQLLNGVLEAIPRKENNNQGDPTALLESLGKMAGIFNQMSDDSADFAFSLIEQKELTKEKKQLDKLAIEAEKELERAKAKGNQEEIDKAQAAADKLNDDRARLTDKINAKDEENQERRAKETEENFKQIGENLDKQLSQAFENILSDFTSGVEKAMDSFLETQESMAYNLTGTDRELSDVVDKLNGALSGTGIVEQKTVYKNLNSLLTAGIVYNAEQRAYLATLSEDLEMGFNVQSAALTRLVNIQREDLTSNRMAIQDSLKTFLNQNYETSQYIKEGFENVSSALLEAQSWMTSEAAVDLEAVVQQWLGSMVSLGLSNTTATNLATGIGNLGSGNLTSLAGDKLQTLIILGASRSGLDYADLLTNGVSAQAADALMSGIANYLQEVAGRESNVVKSAFTDLLGITMSDLKSITNMVNSPTSGGVISSDISGLLGRADSYVYLTKQVENILQNVMYSAGTDIASTEWEYILYKSLKMVSGTIADALEGTTATLGFLGNGVELNLSEIANLVPTVTLLSMSTPALFQGLGNLGSLFTQSAGLDIYNALAGNSSKMKVTSTGSLSGLVPLSGLSNSGSVIITEAGKEEALDQAKTSGTETAESFYGDEKATIELIYESIGQGGEGLNLISLLGDIKSILNEFPNKMWGISTTPQYSSVAIASIEDAPAAWGDSLLEYSARTAINTQNILSLFEAYIEGKSEAVYTKFSDEEYNAGLLAKAARDVENYYE